MYTRRNFLKTSTAGALGISFIRKIPENTFPSSQKNYLTIISTWNHGLKANEVAWGNDFREGYCNNGNDGLMPVDSWPKGCNQLGICDLTGNVWQLDQTQMLLLVSPGFDRCSTLGFRCIKDIE